MADVATTSAPSDFSTASLFDGIGKKYETAFEGHPEQAVSIQWVLTELAKSQVKPAKILDIGCGTGQPVCGAFADAGHSVIGIDVSAEMVKTAREQVPNATFEQTDVREFKGEDSSFDAITVYFSMIAGVTQDEIRAAIQQIYTWLKPGGVFVFATVPVTGNNLEIKWMGKPVVVSSLDPEDYVEWIGKVGFEIVERRDSKFLPKAVDAGICGPDEVWEEPHLFVYAKKK
jgi:ubiquinone/menaquinone biosynthesis C-methylase UbiE